jgi:hypothetical protein
MVKYSCEPCKYESHDFGNYGRHTKSAKHHQICAIVANIIPNVPGLILEQALNVPKHLPNDMLNPEHVPKHVVANQPEHAPEHVVNNMLLPTIPINENLKKIYKCEGCENTFKTSSSFSRHRLHRCPNLKNPLILAPNKDKIKYENKNEKSDYEKLKEELLKKDEDLQKKDDDIKYLKSLVEKAGKIADTTTKIADQNSKNVAKSMNALSYIMKNYPNAPGIESIKQLDYTTIRSGDNDTTTTIAAYYDDGLLDKYLAEFVVAYYKTDDLSKRSFWGSDVSRTTFITRVMSGTNLQWIYDMKGKCVGKSIIEPMLEHIKAESLAFIDQVPTKLLKLSVADGLKLTAVQKSAYKAIDDINSGMLKQNIIREISPYFYLNKTSKNGDDINNDENDKNDDIIKIE